MRTRGRTDANQSEIVRELRARGCSVMDISGVGAGMGDLLVGHRGRNIILEVKMGPTAKLTPAQIRFSLEWAGQWARVSNSVEAWEVVQG